MYFVSAPGSCEDEVNGHGCLLNTFGNSANLLHHTHEVVLDPVLDDLAIGYPHDVDTRNRDCLTCGWHTEELAVVSPLRLKPARHLVAFGHEVLSRNADVGETVANHDGPFFHAVGAGQYVGRAVMVNAVLGNNFFRDGEVAFENCVPEVG